jgi:hypothetical protein
MKVGCINYAHARGLGHLMRDFHAHGIITDVCVVKHPGIPTRADEWYPGAPTVDLRRIDTRVLQDFVSKMDVMLYFETPFWWPIMPFARAKGIRSVLCPMMECTPVSHEPPDLYVCPSLLDYNEYFPDGKPARSIFLPLPTEYPWRLRTRAEHFVHRGGYLGCRGREGTTLLIEAMRHVKSSLRLTVSVQENVDAAHQRMAARDPRIEYRAETIPYEELYGVGDVAVMPQKFNGVSLPLQEACAAGMLVMASDRFPANSWLPIEPLIPVAGYRKARIGGGYMEFDEAQIRPEDIAATLDGWYGRDITVFSLKGKAWAEQHSWQALKPRWLEAIAS